MCDDVGGLCPGPGVIGVLSGDLKPIVYVASMFGGFMLTHLYRAKRDEPKASWKDLLTRHSTIQYTIGLGALMTGLYYLKPMTYVATRKIQVLPFFIF
jgi:hypothetical protein